jgi:hypothetical protein
MKPSNLRCGEHFTFKRRDPFKRPLEGIMCVSLGGGQFQFALPQWGASSDFTVDHFHHKDRVKRIERAA